MPHRTVLCVALLAVMALVAGCAEIPPANATPGTTPAVTALATQSATPATSADLIAFVHRAASFARDHGRVTALAAVNAGNSPFVAGDVYIFAVDYNGTLLADPEEPGRIGTDISTLTDAFGVPVGRRLGETARFGIGLVSYDRPGQKNTSVTEPALAVVEDVDGAYYVAAGFSASGGDVFPSLVMNTTGAKSDREDLVAHVKSAVTYARENGKERAIAAFNDPEGSFARDGPAIMALDYNGTSLASPPYASELAANRVNLLNYNDPDGVGTIRGMRDLARSGGGFLYTVARVSVNTTDVLVPKINYAEPVDDTWWLFAALVDPAYAQVAAGNLTGIPLRQHTRPELYDMVSRAVDYARTNGNAQALSAIDDPAGPFVDGDLFVWAEGTNGTVLADPFWKEGIGQNYLDVTDPNGAKTTKVGIDAMQNGTGFSHALFQDTAANGTALVPKLVYMKAVDDAWWIGGGVYGVDVK